MESIVAQHLFDTRPATDLSWDDAGHEVLYPEEDDVNYSLSFVSDGEENLLANEEKKDTMSAEGEDNKKDDSHCRR